MREEATVMLGESQPKTRGLRGQLSHSPTHWQTFFTRSTLRLLRNRFPGDVPLARTRTFRFSPLCPKGSTQTVLHCAHRGSTFLNPSLPPRLLLSSQGSLVDPRVRASNEHLLSVRVPRAGGRPGCPSLLSCLTGVPPPGYDPPT